MRHVLRIVAVLSLALLCVPAIGQAAADPPAEPVPSSPPTPTREAIQARLAALGEADTAARELLNEALSLLDRRSVFEERAAESRRRAAEAPGLLEAIRKEMETPAEEARPEVPADATLAQLEQRASEAVAQLELARQAVAELQTEAARRQERRTQIPESIAAARSRLNEIGEITVTPGEAERTSAQDARVLRSVAEREALRAEITALEAELAEYDARRELLPARRDRAARRVSRGEKLVAEWQTIVTAKRRQAAEQEAREAERLQREAARQHPVLQAFAAESQAMAERRTQPDGVLSKIAAASRGAGDARAELNTIRSQYAGVRRRIEAGGLTRATGLLLRRHYDALMQGLTNPSSLRRRALAIQRELELAEAMVIEREDDRIEAGAVERVVSELMAAVSASGIEATNRETVEAVARDLAVARRDLLGLLEQDANNYAAELFGLERATTTLLEAVEAYESYIRERILWVRSVPREDAPGLRELRATIEKVTDPAGWSSGRSWAQTEARRRWASLTVIGAGLVLLFVLGRWAKRELLALGEKVGRFRTDAFVHTLLALPLTGLVALPLGTTLFAAGWFMSSGPTSALPVLVLGAALRVGGTTLVALSALQGIFRAGGLADLHFRWPVAIVRQVRLHMRWFVPVAVVSAAAVAASDAIGTEAADGTLGRLAFSVLLVASLVVLVVMARPSGPIAQAVARKGGWVERLRVLWMPLLPLMAVVLLAITWLGYFYTARQLATRAELTLVLAVGLLLANAVLMRWLFIARRRVAVEDARRKREQAIAERAAKAEKKGKGDAPTESAMPAIDEDKLDLPAISLQTQQLFRTGLLVVAVIGFFAAWADVLPALRMLDRVQVYPSFGVMQAENAESLPILESARAPAGSSAPQAAGGAPSAGNAGTPAGSRPEQTPAPGTGMPSGAVPLPIAGSPPAEAGTHVVSLADVGLAIILLVATSVAFRNVPGLVEIVVLQRLPLDAGSRYALSTVLRYAIAFVGIVLAFGAIDITWSNIQWLAAALTFGLAFGLQEIFANFVSGLIILAERPIRIGDTVTVGSINGTVTRIRMRATTITDWDRKELIIPNKAFITGDVINWTLSDPVLRLTVPVGISYGADVRLAQSVLERIAGEIPEVLSDPAPFVHFRAFGDSTLDFELRLYLPHVDKLLLVRHEAHMRITEAFREAGIEIAFPQRDLHIRSFEGLERIAGRPVIDAGAIADES